MLLDAQYTHTARSSAASGSVLMERMIRRGSAEEQAGGGSPPEVLAYNPRPQEVVPVSVQLNHTIVPARDAKASATYLASVLGREIPTRFGPFFGVEVDNGVTLDFMTTAGEIPSQHYAFLVSEQEFDEIFARIREQSTRFWADPGQHRPGEINRRDGGRGIYWEDPNGHLLEILTRPYGSGR